MTSAANSSPVTMRKRIELCAVQFDSSTLTVDLVVIVRRRALPLPGYRVDPMRRVAFIGGDPRRFSRRIIQYGLRHRRLWTRLIGNFGNENPPQPNYFTPEIYWHPVEVFHGAAIEALELLCHGAILQVHEERMKGITPAAVRRVGLPVAVPYGGNRLKPIQIHPEMVRSFGLREEFKQCTCVQRRRIHRVHLEVFTRDVVLGVSRLLDMPFGRSAEQPPKFVVQMAIEIGARIGLAYESIMPASVPTTLRQLR